MATAEQIRQACIDEARNELEATGGKAGPSSVSGYRREVGLGPLDGTHWCGIFCLAMLHRAGLAKDVKWKLGSGFCERELKRVRRPEPGDIAVYGAPNWHHAIVTAVDESKSTFDSIDGNQGHPVTIKARQGVSLRKPFAFYSITKFVEARLVELAVSDGVIGPRTWPEPEDTSPETPETKGPDTQPPAPEPTLRIGDTGEWVEFLQKTLETLFVGIKVDGQFGPVTQRVVKHFQHSNALVADGVVGPRTWHALLRE